MGDGRPAARRQREAACGTGVRAYALTVGAGLALRTVGDFRPKGDARAGAADKAMAPPPPDAITGVYRQAAQDGAVRAYMGFSNYR